MVHRGAPDHKPGDPCFLEPLQGDLGVGDVPVSDHRNRHGTRDLGDDRPVRRPRISLFLRPAVDGNPLNSRCLEDPRDFHGIDRAGIPPGPDFCRHRHSACGRDNSLRDSGQQRGVAEQGGSAVFADYFVHWAPEVQIDEIRSHPVDDRPRRFREVGGIRPEQLDPERPFLRMKIEIPPGPLVAVKDSLRRNELGGEHVGAKSFAQAAEHSVGHTRHRSEKQQRARGGGWQGLSRWAIRAQRRFVRNAKYGTARRPSLQGITRRSYRERGAR